MEADRNCVFTESVNEPLGNNVHSFGHYEFAFDSGPAITEQITSPSCTCLWN